MNSRQWREGYVPHIRTWLHQKQWEDVLEEVPESADSFTDEEWGMLQAHYRKSGSRGVVCAHLPECKDDLTHAVKVLAVLKAMRS